MPVVTVYQNGSSAGCPPTNQNHDRAKRSTVQGWSARSSRSLTVWLKSVDSTQLSGFGFNFTLTFSSKHYPENSQEFHKLRRAFGERLRRMGMIRSHWLVEWTASKIPHIHGMVYFPDYDPIHPSEITRHWLEITKHLGTRSIGQDSKPIHDAVGWAKYLAKHAGRGVYHYQRCPENIPAGWKTTGRMWGKIGQWPDDFQLRFEVDMPGYHVLRRMFRAWRLAEARKVRNSVERMKRIRTAKTCLRCHDKRLSAVRGVSEWPPLDVSLQFVHLLALSGYQVEST